MKKIYFIALLAFVVNLANAQFIESTTYRGAFAPAPTAMWTDSWTNWDPQNEAYTDASTVVNQTTNITVNTTWTTGKTYKLTGLIYVTNGATLTIQPGVVVKGVYTNTGTALIITKGAKLNAIGTASAPIVFTSGKTAGSRAAGDWGGIILLGKAGFNVNSGINNIEGITATVNTEYGGGTAPTNTDNSGTMKYCRIEFPGFVFSPNNEINGLTLGAVGNGTTIDYVQVSFSGDDSFEWFGGSVNCKHLVSYRGLDDDFDTDNGYKGSCQFLLGIKDPATADNPAISTSEGFESDNSSPGGAPATGYDNTSAIFTNCTMIGPSGRGASSVATGHERPARLRKGTFLKVYNSLFMDFKTNYLFIDSSGNAPTAVTNAGNGNLKFKNNIIAGTANSSYPQGVNPTSLGFSTTNTPFTGCSYIASTGLLTKPYGATSTDYIGDSTNGFIDYRPGTSSAAYSGADFTDSSLTGLVNVIPTGSTPTVSNRVYCKGDLATPLTATLTTTGESLKWYTGVTNTTTSVITYTLIATGTPTPATTAAGTKTYYVSQLAAGVESAKVPLTVTVNDIPTEVVSAITGQGPVTSASGVTPETYASATAVGPYVGTSSVFTYSVTAFTGSGLTYVWSVPQGVNILSGQGTNSITVNFSNVVYGAGTVGSIQIQAQNASGCRTVAKTLVLSTVLPTAPATILMYNKNLTGTAATTAISNPAAYLGTSTSLTLTAGVVAAATAYQWELPTGVNVVIPTGTATPTPVTATYTAEPFVSVNTAPSTVGTKYWVKTSNTYVYDVNGISTSTTISTVAQKIVGSTRTYTFTIAAGAIGVNAVNTLFTYNGDTYKLTTATTATSTSVVCTYSTALPGNFPTALTTTVSGTLTKVSDSSTIAFSKIVKAGYDVTTSQAYAPYGTVVTSNLPSILVNFAGASSPTLYLGVKSVNAVGSSVTSNATIAATALTAAGSNATTADTNNPGLFYKTYTETFVAPNATTLANATSTYAATGFTPSTAKTLKLVSTIPAAPASVILNVPGSTTAVTIISKYVGTSTPLTLTAAVSALASSYEWELPSGVNVVSGNASTDRIITVNFAGIPSGVTTYYIGAKAKNAIGSSTTANTTLVPSTSSTAKLLKVSTTLPVAVSAVSGQLVSLCGGPISYTMTASALANEYYIVAPTGAIVSSASFTSNNSNVLQTSDLTFTVTYPSAYSVTTTTATADKSIVITSLNGVGSSLTTKVLPLATALGAVGTNTNSYANPTTGVTNVTLFGKCATQTFTVPAVPYATGYVWTLPSGATGSSETNSIVIDFAAVSTPLATTKVILKVKAWNGCVYSAEKSISLTFDGLTSCARMSSSSVLLEASQIFPNPTSDMFTIDLNMSSRNEMTMSILSINGTLVSSRKLDMNQGLNTVSEDVSGLTTGLYFVEFNNVTTGERIVKKLIKK